METLDTPLYLEETILIQEVMNKKTQSAINNDGYHVHVGTFHILNYIWICPERVKGWNQSKNNTQSWMGLVIEARSDAVKSNIA